MKKREIRVVTPGGRDGTALSETLSRLGYPVAEATSISADRIVVVDARASVAADWAEIERDLCDQCGPTVVISDDNGPDALALGQRLGRSVVFASGGSELGYNLAIKLCSLLMEERAAEVAA